jgi:hypothetical protein
MILTRARLLGAIVRARVGTTCQLSHSFLAIFRVFRIFYLHNRVITNAIDCRYNFLMISDGYSSTSSSALPETPAPRRREKLRQATELKSSSNPQLTIPPKLLLAHKFGSAAGSLGRERKEVEEAPDSPSIIEDSMLLSPMSSNSIKISSPLDISNDSVESEKASLDLSRSQEYDFGDRLAFVPPPRVGPTPPPCVTPQSPLRVSAINKEEAPADEPVNYCPHPNTIAMTTRGSLFFFAQSSIRLCSCSFFSLMLTFAFFCYNRRTSQGLVHIHRGRHRYRLIRCISRKHNLKSEYVPSLRFYIHLHIYVVPPSCLKTHHSHILQLLL